MGVEVAGKEGGFALVFVRRREVSIKTRSSDPALRLDFCRQTSFWARTFAGG